MGTRNRYKDKEKEKKYERRRVTKGPYLGVRRDLAIFLANFFTTFPQFCGSQKIKLEIRTFHFFRRNLLYTPYLHMFSIKESITVFSKLKVMWFENRY